MSDKNTLHAPGVKDDSAKLPVFRGFVQYFPRAIRAVSKVSKMGADKYLWGGWATVEEGIMRYSEARERHILDEASGEKYDPESDLLHAAHIAWNAMAVLELMCRDIEKQEASKAPNAVEDNRI